jgi:hypothetical protein
MHKPHDVGGHDYGPVDINEHPLTFSDKQIDAVSQLLRSKGFWTTDANRRAIESIDAKLYAESTYYERWTLATKALAIELGLFTEEEFQRKLKDVTARLKSEQP